MPRQPRIVRGCGLGAALARHLCSRKPRRAGVVHPLPARARGAELADRCFAQRRAYPSVLLLPCAAGRRRKRAPAREPGGWRRGPGACRARSLERVSPGARHRRQWRALVRAPARRSPRVACARRIAARPRVTAAKLKLRGDAAAGAPCASAGKPLAVPSPFPHPRWNWGLRLDARPKPVAQFRAHLQRRHGPPQRGLEISGCATAWLARRLRRRIE
jgi:hypothetical protein